MKQYIIRDSANNRVYIYAKNRRDCISKIISLKDSQSATQQFKTRNDVYQWLDKYCDDAAVNNAEKRYDHWLIDCCSKRDANKIVKAFTKQGYDCEIEQERYYCNVLVY